jgi:hypothetical protein
MRVFLMIFKGAAAGWETLSTDADFEQLLRRLLRGV